MNQAIEICFHLLGYDVDFSVVSGVIRLLDINQLDYVLMVEKFCNANELLAHRYSRNIDTRLCIYEHIMNLLRILISLRILLASMTPSNAIYILLMATSSLVFLSNAE